MILLYITLSFVHSITCRAEALFVLEKLVVRRHCARNQCPANCRLRELTDEKDYDNGTGRNSAGGKIENV